MTVIDPDFITQAPDVSEENLRKILLQEFGISNVEIKRLIGYDDLNFQLENFAFLPDNNAKLQAVLIDLYGSLNNAKAILKISNPVEARVPNLSEAQNHLMKVLTKHGIPCPALLPFKDGSEWKFVKLQHENNATLVVWLPIRMFSFLPGEVIEKFFQEHPNTSNREVFELIGRLLAHFHNITDTNFTQDRYNETVKLFQQFHPLVSSNAWPWLKHEFETLCSLGLIDAKKAELCQKVFDDFLEVLKIEKTLEQGINHSDFNESNILLNSNSALLKVSGLLDFGDAHWSARIFDISSSLFYLILDYASRTLNIINAEFFKSKLQEFSKYYLNEYLKHRIGGNLCNERKYLAISMKSRLVASIIYSMHVVRIGYRKTSNWEYIRKTQEPGWKVLEAISDANIDNIFDD